jgi:transposase
MAPRKEICASIRNLVVQLRKEKKSYGEIAETVKLSRATIQTIVRNFEERGSVLNKPRCGRPKKLSGRDVRSILKKVIQNPRIGCPKLAEQIANTSGKVVNPKTIGRVLKRSGYNSRVPRKKPLISTKNKELRLDFARRHLNENNEYWNRVLFTDESKFNIFGSDGRRKIWRKANTALQSKNIIHTTKHGGGSVMVWGAMAAAGVGNLVFIDTTMDRFQYLTILKDNLKASVEKLGLEQSWIFQQDNDPKHTAIIVKEWLLYNVPKQLHSPPQSPDLNPIEHIWDEVERKLRKYHISNKKTLKEALIKAWAEITPEITRNLVLSMPRRLQAVIDAEGGPTRY